MTEDADEVNHADQARRGAEDGIRTRDPLLGKEAGLSAVRASSRPQAKGVQLPSGGLGVCAP